MEIIKGKIPGAKKIIIYGPEGIGKSTFASKFPDPVFIDTEGSTKDMDVARTPAPSSWAMLLEQVKYFIGHSNDFKTLVIDTADWAEQLCVTDICSRFQKAGIEDFGYGKGYTYLQEEFGRLLNLLTELVEQKGVNVVLTAHAKMRKFEQPDELGAYDRWEMKLSKGVAPMVKEWGDMVLFANYKTIVVNVDGQGAQKGKNKVQGGKRVMYTTHHSCWDAKNRYGLPDEIPMDYEEIRSIIETQIQLSQMSASTSQEEKRKAPTINRNTPDPSPADKSSSEPEKKTETASPVDRQPEPVNGMEPPTVDERIPKKLRDLMIANRVDEWDIQAVCEAKGYIPAGTPLYQYDEVNPGFIEGCLVAAWGQVYSEIKGMKQEGALVFN